MELSFEYYAELFEIELFVCIKMDLALNNLQLLIWHETKPIQINWIYLKKQSE